jgi:DtxR family Mn-dependent transcriptional regulator
VSDRDPDLLRALVDAGVDVGHEVEVGAEGSVRVDGRAVTLPAGAADAVWLTA